MTTHYQKIQALGERMASNLETMGVSASFNDGGLTLADKILQIQRFNDGIILYGDKIIAQSADTVNLYALLLDDKIPQSGETVKFYADKILVTDTASPGDSLYEDYYVTSEKTGSSWDYIGSGSTGFIQFNSEKINTYHSSWSGEVSHNGDKIHIKDGVLTYHDTSDVEQTIDVSAIDTTQAYTTAAFTVYYYWVEATTGSNGVANYQYTCTGAGKINFSAKSGGIVSQPYPVIDALFKDMGTSTDYGSWSDWGSQNEYKPKITRTDYCKVEVDTGKSGARIYKTIDTSNNDIAIEFDVKQVTSSANNVWATLRNDSVAVLGNVDMSRFISYGGAINEWVHFKFVVGASSVQVYVNNNTTPFPYNISGMTRFYLQIDTNTTELDYKNFVIYPV